MPAALRWRPGFLTALLLAGLGGCAGNQATGPTAGESGVDVKPVTYGGLQDTVKQLRGKVVVVDFWEFS